MKHWHRRHTRHSLSGKLILLFIAMALLFMVLVGASLDHVFRSHFEDNIRPHLVQYIEYVQNDIGNPPNRERARILADKLNIEIHIIDPQGQWSSNNQRVQLDDLEVEHRIKENGREYLHVEYERQNYLLTEIGDVTLLFNIPHVRQGREGFKGFVPLVVLLLVLVVLYYSTRRIFSPIEQIQKSVKRFGAGELDHRISIHRRDELGELANSFNTMADDIQHMLDAKRQLLLAISHELRSPITRAKVATELLGDNDQKLQLNQDLDVMDNLIEEIMETERLSTSHKVLNIENCNLNELISDVRTTYFIDSSLQLELPDNPVIQNVDVARLKLLIKNLLENALKHTPESATVPQVKLYEETEKVIIEVIDKGIGIEEKHIPHLTEPFYRVDPSRQRETGGYGLGLYLCRMIAEAHNGELLIVSKPNQGTTVRITIPRNI